LIQAGDRAVVVCNGPEHLSALRYKDAFEARGVATTLVSMTDVMRQIRHRNGKTLFDIANEDPYGRNVDVDDIGLDERTIITKAFSFAVLVTNDFGPYAGLVSQLVEGREIELLNNAVSLAAANDKWETHVRLRDAGVPIVKALLVHDFAEALIATQELGYPLVLKELRGTQGNGVRLVQDDDTLRTHCVDLEIERQPLLLEHYIECSSTDKRILMMDGRFVGAMERHAKSGDFRANISLGGTALPCEVTTDELEATRAAAKAIGLRLVGSDIARVTTVLPGREYLPAGSAFCIEANSMPALADLSDIVNGDCAEKVVEILFEAQAGESAQL
jgi:RimK family alpha-L-glutamate ligase